MRHLEGGVTNLAGLLAEDRPKEALLRGELGLALRGDLADEHVAGADFGADADDAAVVEVGRRMSSERFGMSRVISSGPSLVSRASTSCSLMWIDVSTSSLHQALAEDDGVLEVVALPRHQRDEEVLAERELTAVGRGTVGDDVALLRPCRPRRHDGVWLMQVSWFERRNLCEAVDPLAVGLVLDGDAATRRHDRRDLTVVGRLDQVGGVACGAGLDAGADVRRLGT